MNDCLAEHDSNDYAAILEAAILEAVILEAAALNCLLIL